MKPLPGGSPVSDVVMPGDDVYDDLRRIYNSLHDQHPALIVRVAETSDVARALELARVAGHEVAVRGGGHSIAGHGSTEGGLLIDLAGLDHIDIDARDPVARVGAGVTAGRLTAASCRQDLVVPLGDSPDVGVGGITLGGGIGWLSRKLGLTLDSLERAEVVTADGRVVTASEDDHSDLFWAIRGGGGNFGVVTEFRYRLHPIGAIVGGLLALPASTDVLLGIIELAAAAPDELGIISLVTRLPPLGFVPPEAHGRPAILIRSSGAAIREGETAKSTGSGHSRPRSSIWCSHDAIRRCTQCWPRCPHRSRTSPPASSPTNSTRRRSMSSSAR